MPDWHPAMRPRERGTRSMMTPLRTLLAPLPFDQSQRINEPVKQDNLWGFWEGTV